jgi:hypothetical protein
MRPIRSPFCGDWIVAYALSCLRYRHREPEGGSSAGRAVYVQLLLVCLYQSSSDGEPEPSTAVSEPPCMPKPIEHVREIFRRDARPRIGNAEPDARLGARV